MASNLGQAQGSIVIDSTSLDRVEAKAKRVGQSVGSSLGSIGAGAKRAEGGISSLAGSVKGLAAAYGLVQVATTAFDLAKLAATNDRTGVSFERLADSIGASGDQMLESLQKTSRGAISDADLMLNANRAILLGAAKTSQEINQLLEIARVRGQAVGRDTSESFSRIIQGVGKLEPEGLDELGIAVNLVQVFDQYAKSLGRTAQSLTQAEKRTALFNRVIADSAQIVKDAANESDDAALGFERFETSLTNAKNAVGELLLAMGAGDTVDTFTRSITDSEKFIQSFTTTLERMGAVLNAIKSGNWDVYVKANIDLGNAIMGRTSLSQAMGAGADIARPKIRSGIGGGGGIVGPTDEQLADRRTAQLNFQRDIAGIERDANAQRLSATQSYEQQRSETIRSYEQGIARDAQDFAISRARAAAQLADTIADIGADAAEREAEWAADLGESIATIHSEGNEQIADIERNYQRDRERAAQAHRDNLFSAAGRLDAVAVAAEQRSYARSSREAEEGYQEQLSQAQENLDERIAQEQEAHAERLADAREADAERIAEAKDSLAESQRIEDEDRALTAARNAEDYAAQLTSMAAAHGAQMTEIDRQEDAELQSAKDAHLKELEETGLFNKAWKDLQDAREKAALESWDKFWVEFNKRLKIQGPQTEEEAKANQWTGLNLKDPATYPGYMGRSGLEYMRQGESVANMQAQASGRSSAITVASGAIQINGSGLSPEAIAEAVNRRLLEHYKELSN